jgi:hypothetical protein
MLILTRFYKSKYKLKNFKFPNAETENQQPQHIYVADDGAAVEMPPPATTKHVMITESAANNEISFPLIISFSLSKFFMR